MLFSDLQKVFFPSHSQSLKATRNFSVSDWSKNFEVIFQDEEGELTCHGRGVTWEKSVLVHCAVQFVMQAFKSFHRYNT